MQLAPESADAHYQPRNGAWSFGGVFDEAIQQLLEAVRIDPSLPSAHYELANAYRAQQRLDLAVAEYRQAIRLSPDFADAHNNLGITLGSLGRVKEAADEFPRRAQGESGIRGGVNPADSHAGPSPMTRTGRREAWMDFRSIFPGASQVRSTRFCGWPLA